MNSMENITCVFLLLL